MTKFVRRLQRIGSSHMVSLPKEWVDANDLQKSSPVELDVSDNAVCISAARQHRPARELVISYPLPAEENITADITGGYLLGYDAITIESEGSIPSEDREQVRNSMRRLVGMEIIEEDSSRIRVQFLLDTSTISPDRILRRISSIAMGMFNDILASLISGDRTNLKTLHNRDLEVNRQYFLLVRLIRSILVDARPAADFHLENIDILDYRLAASLLENGGDAIVELGQAILHVDIDDKYLRGIYGAARNLEEIATKTVDSFVNRDRMLAIEAIALHRGYQESLSALRASGDVPLSVEHLDLIHMFERVAKSWADIVDLVKPIYAKS